MSEPAAAQPQPDRPTRSRAATRQLWGERLDRFARSGLTPTQFCAAEGLALPSFYAWKRRLAAEHCDGPAATAADEQPGPRLLPVCLRPAAAPELVLPGGAVLRIPPGCDLAWLRALVAALGGVPC
jgi:transposase